MNHEDPLDMQGQDRQLADIRQHAKSEETLKVDDFKWLMGSKRGRRIVWRLLDETGVYRTSMTGNSSTFFNEGRRDVGLRLMAMINDHCTAEFVLMLNERTKT